MRWKEINEDASGSSPPAGWAKALDRGIDDADNGCVVPIAAIINDLDKTLAEMANESENQVGHGDNIQMRCQL